MKPTERFHRFQWPWKTKPQIDAEVAEEFEFHVRSRAEELEETGVAPDDARRRAEAEFGDAQAARAYCRHVDLRHERGVRRTERLGELRLDLISVGRNLARTPGSAVIIVAMLGIALGINLITFTLANAPALAYQGIVRWVPDPGPSTTAFSRARAVPSK